jgi:hypothetical protein
MKLRSNDPKRQLKYIAVGLIKFNERKFDMRVSCVVLK